MTTFAADADPAVANGAAGPDRLDVLVIEDSAADAAVVRALLADELGDAQHSAWAKTLTEGRAALLNTLPSCVLLDLGLPDSAGLDTLDEVLAAARDTAVVVFTALNDDRAGRQAVTRGAQDFLVKGKTDGCLLVRSIRYAVDRKHAETARRRSEERFGLAIDSMVDAVFVMGAVRDDTGAIIDFTYLHANPAGEAMLGVLPDGVAGRRLLDVAPGHRGPLLDRYRRVVDADEPLTGEIIYDGTLPGHGPVVLTLDVKAVRFGDGYVVSIRDVTARDAAQTALRDSEERFRALIEHSIDIIVVVDGNGFVSYASPASERVLGYDPATMLGTSALDLVHPDDVADVTATLAAAASTLGIAPPTRFRIHHASGTWRWVESVANNRLDDPAVRGIVINAHDITEQEQAAVALDHANRVLRTLAAADAAVVYASHEQNLVDAMCELIVETGGYPRAWIARPEPTHPSGIVPVATYGGDPGFITALLKAVDSEFSGPVRDAALHGVTQVVQDVSVLPADLAVRRVILEHGYHSLIALPLRVEDDVIGALAIYAHDQDAFDPSEIALLDRLAADLAYGITSLRARVERQGYLTRLERDLDALVNTIATTVEYRDPYTAGHQRRVAELSVAIAHELGLDAVDIAAVGMAASIHDIGKISIPSEILAKPGRLSTPELELIKQHAQAGYDIVKDIEFPGPVAEMILQHHERIDGSGYPRGLLGRDMLLGARIIAVADTVEAMGSHRPYRPSLGVAAALREIEDERGRLFDTDVAEACLRLFQEERFRLETS